MPAQSVNHVGFDKIMQNPLLVFYRYHLRSLRMTMRKAVLLELNTTRVRLFSLLPTRVLCGYICHPSSPYGISGGYCKSMCAGQWRSQDLKDRGHKISSSQKNQAHTLASHSHRCLVKQVAGSAEPCWRRNEQTKKFKCGEADEKFHHLSLFLIGSTN